MGIDLALLAQLERLAALDLDLAAPADPAERQKLCADLSRVLEHVHSLTGALDTEAPARADDTAPSNLPPLRSDQPEPGLSREAALQAAPHADGATFVVPRIVP